jgi:glycine/D-amino acid oxidase-like deaminating enzyme
MEDGFPNMSRITDLAHHTIHRDPEHCVNQVATRVLRNGELIAVRDREDIEGRPFVGPVPGRPGLWVAGGYSGTGNVSGFLAGRELADMIAGRAGEPLFTS